MFEHACFSNVSVVSFFVLSPQGIEGAPQRDTPKDKFSGTASCFTLPISMVKACCKFNNEIDKKKTWQLSMIRL